ncbi:MAG: Na/Pi cotransporter family protein [Oscillospiraceae bacterium]|nr:Na/Pi cotransporter family protein [Oscillospiraceae bacterium]
MEVVFAALKLIAGLAFFLYGMHVMSAGLGKMAGGSLERSLRKATSHPVLGMGLGAGITVAIQSSSAMTVMLVGLVNSGLMLFSQTISVLMGSNIGTTVTSWILTLTGVEGSGWMELLKPKNFSAIIAIIGAVLILMSKKTKRQDLGKIMVGFAVLMYGMTFMSDAMEQVKDNPSFQSMLVAFDNPLVALLASTLFTGIIQSSAATIGIVQALTTTGMITFGNAIPLVLGANIGTCATALLSSVGVTREAKKVSVVHIIIKLIGTVIFMLFYFIANTAFELHFLAEPSGRAGIAAIHTVFNVTNTVLLFPFQKQLVRLTDRLVRSGKREGDGAFLDERLIGTPSVAVNEAMVQTKKMAELAQKTLETSLELFHHFDEKTAEQIMAAEDELDNYEDKLGSFLVKLSSRALSDHDSRRVSLMLHTIGDFERLGDHAVNLLKGAREIKDKEITFSENAQAEIRNLTNAVSDILSMTVRAFREQDRAQAGHVEPLEQVIDVLIAQSKSRHIERLQLGKCTIQTGFVLSDLLTNYERISDHCSNIAVAVIETGVGSFDTHAYLNDIKTGGSRAFVDDYKRYAEKYGAA